MPLRLSRAFVVSFASLVALLAFPLLVTGCQRGETRANAGVVQLDGSSTVFPISEAVAEAYQQQHGGRVTIGVSGTGGGFKKLCRGEVAMAGASRPIKPSEVELCRAGGVEYLELPIAYDGIALVVHKENSWVDHMTVAELKRLWEPAAQAKVTKWSQVRTGWPDEEIHLFGPGVDSGTYDYFTQAIVGVEHSSRGDFTSSEDDNVIVQGVSTDRLALGFFGYAYYAENQDILKLVPIDDGDDTNGKGPVAPSPETVGDGTYQPLSRPVFLYVNKAALERPEVQRFARFYLEQVPTLASRVGYIALPSDVMGLVKQRLEQRRAGSLFEGGSEVGVSLKALLSPSEG